MQDMVATISLLSLLGTALLLTRLLLPRNRVESLLIFMTMLATLIVLLGYGLSMANVINKIAWWTAGSLGILILTATPILLSPLLRQRCMGGVKFPHDIEQRLQRVNWRSYENRLLLLLGITLALTAVINFVVLLWLEPATLDALDYHLARVAYYLQQGNLHYFQANYWAIVIYPKVATILHLYSYLVSNNMSLTQMVQFIAYFVAMGSIYGISRQLGAGRRASLFSALVFSLLTICLVEANTALNDLIMTAFTGVGVYSLVAYRATGNLKYALVGYLAIALLVGVKFTFIMVCIPLLFLCLLLLFSRHNSYRMPALHLVWICVFFILTLLIIALPSGYWENYCNFNDPLGPQSERAELTQENSNFTATITGGSLNLLRYGFDTLSLDGFPPFSIIENIQEGLHALPKLLVEKAGWNLVSGPGVRSSYPFDIYRYKTLASESASGWGILGFGLIWPVVILTLLGFTRSHDARLFALATLAYYIVQAFITPYDPFRGRFFTMMTIFAVPTLAFIRLPENRWFRRLYLTPLLLLGCISACCSVTIRSGMSFFPISIGNSSLPMPFTTGRIEQLTRQNKLTRLLNIYETLVPEKATVAITFCNMNYIFFGSRLTRKLIPIHPFNKSLLGVPAEADFLVFTSDVIVPHAGDILLSESSKYYSSLYLRSLK